MLFMALKQARLVVRKVLKRQQRFATFSPKNVLLTVVYTPDLLKPPCYPCSIVRVKLLTSLVDSQNVSACCCGRYIFRDVHAASQHYHV